MIRSLQMACLSTALAGCASTPGARPEDNSVAGHEASARQEESVSTDCKNQTPPPGGVCWSSPLHPDADEVVKQTEMHRKMAADHRAASSTLRDAEARACAGIPERDRDESPFAHRQDIEGVEPLFVPLSGRSGGQRAVGAAVRFRALPGMTAEWLQRVAECHLARNAAMGYAMPEMSYCPLMLRNVKVQVTSTGAAFAVAIRSDDVDTANEIRRRAEALTAR